MHVAFGHGNTATLPAGRGFPSKPILTIYIFLTTFFRVVPWYCMLLVPLNTLQMSNICAHYNDFLSGMKPPD